MPTQTIYALAESQITISGGGQLDGVTQGDGSHLDGLTITLNSNSWETIQVDDNDANFDDNDGNQVLDGAQTFGVDGSGTPVNYASGLRVEAEYQIIVEDSEGNQYTLYGFNINEPGQSPAFGTVEGLAFLADSVGSTEFPPIGEPLTVVSSSEGPKNDTPYTNLAEPPCFTPGTQILTATGIRDVAGIAVGDLVWTLDHGFQPVRWLGHRPVAAEELAENPNFLPIKICKDALGPGLPAQDMHVSPQHRIFVSGWRAQIYAGEDEVLAPAVKLCHGDAITRDTTCEEVTYIHLLFDRHEVIWSNGLLSESFFPAADMLTPTAQEVVSLFPRQFAAQDVRTARACMSDRSAITLVG